MFVSGVPLTCDEEKLKRMFSKHGEVMKVSLKAEKHFATIHFNSAEAANDALKERIVPCEGEFEGTQSNLKVEKRRSTGTINAGQLRLPRGGH